MATRKTKNLRRRTIAVELLKEWRSLERKNDSETIAGILGLSKPTIDKALIYGAVHQQMIIDGITKYFVDRIQRERENASHLKDIQNTQT